MNKSKLVVLGVVSGLLAIANKVAQFSRRAAALIVTAALMLVASLAQASTDPQDIIDAASDKYNAGVAVFIAAAVIGAAILFIKKGLRGRM